MGRYLQGSTITDTVSPAIWPWLEANKALLALFGLLFLSPFISFFQSFSLKDQIVDKKSRADLIAHYEQTKPEGYYRVISRLLDVASTFYGPRLISGQAYGRSLQLAFIYPIMALVFGWLLFDAGTLGGVEFLPEGKGWTERLWRTALLLAAFGIFANIFKFSEYIEGRTRTFLTKLV